ncbi:MAG: hypothetical protein OHK0047_30710 [Leptolyngbyaceae cyanobacterium]
MQEQPKTEKEKMLANELYLASDPELAAESWQAFHLTRLYNGVAAEDMVGLTCRFTRLTIRLIQRCG